MSEKDFRANLPPDIRNMIGKTVQRKLPDGRVIKFLVGDVTGDGKIDDDDIEILRALCAGGTTAEILFEHLTPEQLAACDVTGDGYINREDLMMLCKAIVDKTPGKKIEEKLSNLRKRIKK